MSLNTRTRQRILGLGVLLGIVVLILVLCDTLGCLHWHEPRLYLANESFGELRDPVIHSACGDIKLPALADGQRVRLDLVPRSDCRYTIERETLEGYELLRLIELGRRENADVVFEVGIDYVEPVLRSPW